MMLDQYGMRKPDRICNLPELARPTLDGDLGVDLTAPVAPLRPYPIGNSGAPRDERHLHVLPQCLRLHCPSAFRVETGETKPHRIVCGVH